MRIAIASLVAALIPVFAFATAVETKDKYINCNCHITPGLPWKGEATKTVEHKAAVKHKHKGTGHAVKKADVTPVTDKPKHKHKKIAKVHKEEVSITGDGYPGREGVVTSNKLALPAGKSVYSSGELVYISGRVLDMKCVPVSDAIVEIWQTNPDGQYVRSTLGERLSPGPHFTGSGRATTDNLGRFNFVTTFPGAVSSRAPFIHVRVLHKDFPTLDTEMFFANDQRNSGDPVYTSLNDQQRSMVTAKVWQRDVNNPEMGLGASWDISLNGKNPYRRF